MVNFLFVFDVLFIVLQLIIFIVFYFQTIKFDRTSEYLLTAIALGILAACISLIHRNDEFPLFFGINTHKLLLALQLFLYSLEYLFIFMHFEQATNKVFDWRKIGLFMGLEGILITESVVYVSLGIYGINEFLWDISYNLLGLFSFGFATWYLVKAFIFTGEKTSLYQAISTSIINLGFIIGILATPTIRHYLGIDTISILYIIGEGAKIIGATVFVSIYAYNPDYVERIIFETYGVLIFDLNSGRDLGFLDVRTKSKNKRLLEGINSALLSSLISALLDFLKEAMGAKEYPVAITSRDRVLLFENGKYLGAALIAEKETLLLRKSLRKMVIELESTIDNPDYIEPFREEYITTLTMEKFPYIVKVVPDNV